MTTPETADSHLQEKVFAFLADPAMHPEVQRIDAHAASVFLEGDRALKIKRAVRFPYLDYSTLSKRKAADDILFHHAHEFIQRRIFVCGDEIA
jgi:aminoglycoside phosphotransferase family enzyme